METKKGFKVVRTFVGYGATEADAFENMLFDIHEETKDPNMDNYDFDEIDTDEEGIDPFET